MKKFLSLMLALTLTLALAACRGNEEDSGEDAGDGTPSWQEQYDLGVRYLSEGNYQEAIIAFTAAIAIEPRAEAYTGRAQAYVLSGDTEDNWTAAQADYEAALDLDGTLAEAWLGLADVYVRRGDYDKALEVLREGLEATGGDEAIAAKIEEMERGDFVDSAGLTRRMVFHDQDGTVRWWHDYTYDQQGRVVGATVFDSNGDQIDSWDGYTYDDQGRSLRTPGYELGTGRFTTVSESVYEGDRLVRTTNYSMDGSQIDYQEYTYDARGERTRTTAYGADGQVSYYWEHFYDGAGHMVKTVYYRPDGTSYGHCEWTYDEDGRQTGYYAYDENGELTGYSQ